jgi:phage antirepressor YoqD-like protein
MKIIKNELQDIITGNGKEGESCLIKKAQIHIGGNEIPGFQSSKFQHLKSEEERSLILFIEENGLFYKENIDENNFIAEGAEQKVYRLNDSEIIKINDSIFYEYWKDYFNSLLVHNYFFKSTKYELLGFKLINNELFSVVKQSFIASTEPIDLVLIKQFLEFNNFLNIRNNDYQNETLGLIFEDLHDENIISQNGILFFIDTIFYLTENFYK